MSARIDHATTSGTFSPDGQTFEVDNNVWVVGDDGECVVLDAPHDVDAIRKLVAGRRTRAIVATHAHDDHVRVAPGAVCLRAPQLGAVFSPATPSSPEDQERPVGSYSDFIAINSSISARH
ncbi:hypothetical protein JOF55_001041 [Haloactinomyces albus]|uniref:Metallo-beta-lactamase domain-containing protein n=1 Tax=Haloactinomyces albus TaxID=1352928 RepID=A0AAE3ZBL6_9ACTN|nr:MBL fold metallo-hydrolase [Haloactinomyces albus]MDR7300860.1 hypothetical protein [Haloactinomyces albus]